MPIFTGKGVVANVAQVETFQVTADHVDTTYTMTIGGQTQDVTGTGTGVNDTAAAFQVVLAANTHPYFTAITWTVATDTVTGTSAVAGVPFVAAASAVGTGTIGAGTVATEAESGHHLMLAANYEGGVAPVNSGTISINRNASNVCWDLDTGLDSITLRIPDGEAKVGLDSRYFATSTDGETVDQTVPEYRQHYLKADIDLTVIGHKNGPTVVAAPAQRIKIDNTNTGVGECFIYGVRGSASELGYPTCRLLFVEDSDVVLNVVSSLGGVGIAVEDDGEVSDLSELNFLVTDSGSSLSCGAGASCTTFTQYGGRCLLRSADDVTLVTLNGGTLETQDGLEFQITTLTINGGTAILGNSDAADICVATLNGNGGTVNMSNSKPASIISTLSPAKGFSLVMPDSSRAVTAWNEAAGSHTIAWS